MCISFNIQTSFFFGVIVRYKTIYTQYDLNICVIIFCDSIITTFWGFFRFAPSTMSKIRWAVNTFKEWQKNSNQISKNRADISPILVDADITTKDDLNYTVSCLIYEAKKADGSKYPRHNVRCHYLFTPAYVHNGI